jgi:hypothetical protein
LFFDGHVGIVSVEIGWEEIVLSPKFGDQF